MRRFLFVVMFAITTCVLSAAALARADVLFSDNFTVNYPDPVGNTPDTTDLNYNLAGRQGGSLVTSAGGSTINWIGSTATWQRQVGNRGSAVDGGSGNFLQTAENGSALLDHSFNNVTGPLTIEWDMAPNVNNVSNELTTFITLGSKDAIARDTTHNNLTLAFNGMGGGSKFNNGVNDWSSFFWYDLQTPYANHMTDLSHMKVVLSDASDGTRSPFGATTAYYDVIFNGTWVANGWIEGSHIADGYISFGSSSTGVDPIYISAADNLSVSGVVPTVPEPSTLVLAGMGLFGLLCYAWRKRR